VCARKRPRVLRVGAGSVARKRETALEDRAHLVAIQNAVLVDIKAVEQQLRID
jgi:hypothetical protein